MFERLMKRPFAPVILAVLFAINAWSAEPFYIGTWKIAAAIVAPWWTGTKEKPDAAESRTLVGQSIVIMAKTINGPRQIACKDPSYRVKS
jgi:hypothetical protein